MVCFEILLKKYKKVKIADTMLQLIKNSYCNHLKNSTCKIAKYIFNVNIKAKAFKKSNIHIFKDPLCTGH